MRLISFRSPAARQPGSGALSRRTIVAGAMTAMLLAAAPSSRAEDAYRALFRFLPDLPGWSGEEPDGSAMQMSGLSVTQASRDYTRGDAKVHVQISAGLGMSAPAGIPDTGPAKIETPNGRVVSDTIDGLRFTRMFDTRENSGVVMVALGPKAMLLVQFEGLGEDEGFKIARGLDWKGIAAALPK